MYICGNCAIGRIGCPAGRTRGRSRGPPYKVVYRELTAPKILVNMWGESHEYRYTGGNPFTINTGINGIKYSYNVGNPIVSKFLYIDIFL